MKKFFFLIFSIGIFLLPIFPAKASLVDNISCMKDGNCQLTEFQSLAVNIANLILGLSGSLALLFFVAGGAAWIFSFGRKDFVTWGKSAMINASIGLLIIFSSYLIVKTVVESVTAKNAEVDKSLEIKLKQ